MEVDDLGDVNINLLSEMVERISEAEERALDAAHFHRAERERSIILMTMIDQLYVETLRSDPVLRTPGSSFIRERLSAEDMTKAILVTVNDLRRRLSLAESWIPPAQLKEIRDAR